MEKKKSIPHTVLGRKLKGGAGLSVLGMRRRRQRRATKSEEEEAMREELDMPSEIMYRSVSPAWHGDDGSWQGWGGEKGREGRTEMQEGDDWN